MLLQHGMAIYIYCNMLTKMDALGIIRHVLWQQGMDIYIYYNIVLEKTVVPRTFKKKLDLVGYKETLLQAYL